jgi:hypothetical protein
MGWRPGWPDHPTKVAGHGAADVNPPAGVLPRLPEGSQEEFAVFVRAENRLAVVAAV